MGPRLECRKAGQPVTWSRRRRTHSSGQSVESFVQVFPGNRLAAPVASHRASHLAQQQDVVGDSRERLSAEQRAVDKLLARLSERDEMARQVSTVDGGNVLGIKRAEVA